MVFLPMLFLSKIDNPRDKRIFFGALLVIITLPLYLPVLHHGFINGWDDNGYVTENVHVRSGLKPANVVWAFSTFEQSNWHPLTWLSHMLDCQLFGMNPAAHHYVNVLWHAANVLLLFWVLQEATGALWSSFLVAALFAVHPLNVETVAWVAQRKSLVSAFFSLLTVAAYLSYARYGGWKRYLLILCAFGLAILSKPMAVSVPLLLLLLDYWPLKRLEDLSWSHRWPRLLVEKLPLVVISIASSVITAMAQRFGSSVVPFAALPLPTRLENAVISYVAYLGKIFWPARLAVFYPHPSILGGSPPLDQVVASAVVLLAITGLALYFRRAGYIAVGWAFFLIALVPVIGIVQVGFQGMADRYAYIPSVGIFIAVVWGLNAMSEHAPRVRGFLLLAAFCVIAAFSAATVHYLKYWQDGVTLFSQARTAWGHPDPWLEQLYANALVGSGRTDEALPHYQESCALWPGNEDCHYSIARILFVRGQFRDALNEYQLVLKLTRNRTTVLAALNESGLALLQLGDYDAAQQSFAKVLAIDPDNTTASRFIKLTQNKPSEN